MHISRRTQHMNSRQENEQLLMMMIVMMKMLIVTVNSVDLIPTLIMIEQYTRIRETIRTD